TSADARNVISGNNDDGLNISDAGTSGNLVLGNGIGVDTTGAAALPNTHRGIIVHGGAASNTIGGTSSGAGNVISGNGWDGIAMWDAGTSGNAILGNFIGTDSSGSTGLGNDFYGIWIDASASGNTIGTPGAGNTIASNGSTGVQVTGSATLDNSI